MKTTINKIKGTAMMLAAMMMTVMATFTACSTEELTTDGSNTTQKAPFTVGDFPAYSTDATTRTIGTADAGKTAWAAGDVILVKAEQYSGYDATAFAGTPKSTTLYKMTCTAAASTGTDPTWSTEQYIGSTWTTPTGLTASSYEEGLKITAYYAPNYEWNTTSNELALISGKTAGTAEKLSVSEQKQFVQFGSKSIAIDFSDATRNYSRLRIAADPSTVVKLTCADFTANDGTTTAESGLTATADDKGNAYFYGTWTASAKMDIAFNYSSTDYSIGSKTVAAASTTGTSYALDALALPTTYNQVGAGTSSNPYRIYNATQLQNINNGPSSSIGEGPTYITGVICQNMYFSMENNVNCSAISSFTPIGYDSGKFAGTFEGNGHTISNLTLGVNGSDESGLFGAIRYATIQNLILSDPAVNPSAQYVGALVGFEMEKSYILNCGVTVTDATTHSITNNRSASNENPAYVGGLVGNLSTGYMVACYANIPISKSSTYIYAGGLVGIIDNGGGNGGVYASYATGNVTDNANNNNIGGLVGWMINGNVSGCYASGAVSAPSSTDHYVGGLVAGNNYGTISYCATTSSTGTNGIGVNKSGTVTGCYGNISSYADIYNYITPAAAKDAWVTARTNLPDSYAGKTKTLGELWQTATTSGLKLYWEK